MSIPELSTLADQAPSQPDAPGKLVQRSVWVLLHVGLFLSTFAFAPALAEGSDDHPIGDVRLQYLWFAVYPCVLVALIVSRKRFAVSRLGRVAVIAVCSLALASATWAFSPTFSLRRSVLLCMTALFGYLIATRFTARQLLTALLPILVFIAISSIAVHFVAPDRSVDPIAGGLRGVLVQKNLLGRLMALGIIAASLLFAYGYLRARSLLAAVALFGVTLLLSRSSTGLLVTAAGVASVVFLRSVRTTADLALVRGSALLVGIGGAVLVGSGAAESAVLALTGKDDTLTNRTLIWGVVRQAIELKPTLGYGYASFWLGENGPSRLVWEALNAKVAHAHDGFLDIWLQLGWVGLLLIVVTLLVGFFSAFRSFGVNRSLAGASRIVFLIFVVLYSLGESNLFNYNSLYCIMLTIALFGFEGEAAPTVSPARAISA